MSPTTIEGVTGIAHLEDGTEVRTGPPTRLNVVGAKFIFFMPLAEEITSKGTIVAHTLILGETHVKKAVTPPVDVAPGWEVTILAPFRMSGWLNGD